MSTIYQTKAEGLAVKQEILNQVVSGIKDTATQANAPTAYTPEAYPNGLFETYIVRTPLTMPNNWGSAVTQEELDANYVYFDVKDGVISKEVSFKNNEIADGQVSTEKTDFAISLRIPTGNNLLDPSQIVLNKRAHPVTGLPFDSNDFDAIFYIRIKPDQPYSFKGLYDVAWFDEDKVFISHQTANTNITSPANAYFVSVSYGKGEYNETMLKEGTFYPIEREPYTFKDIIQIKNLDLPKEFTLEDESVTVQKTDFAISDTFPVGANILNPDKVIADKRVHPATGLPFDSTDFDAIFYTRVKPNIPYSFKDIYDLAWFDKDKNLISVGFASTTITSPNGSAYMSVSYGKGAVEPIVREGVFSPVPYEPFVGVSGVKIQDFINDNIFKVGDDVYLGDLTTKKIITHSEFINNGLRMFVEGGNQNFFSAGAGPLVMPTGQSNYGSGTQALSKVTTGVANYGSGAFALKELIDGADNTATGVGAMQKLQGGVGNTSSGRLSLANLINNGHNSAYGDTCYERLEDGGNNTGSGYGCAIGLKQGENNSLFGTYAGGHPNGGVPSRTPTAIWSNNSGVGAFSMQYNESSSNNSYVGKGAFFNLVSGDGYNVGIGTEVFYEGVSIAFNVGVGNKAGSKLVSGLNNVFVGNRCGGESGQKTDAIGTTVIGHSAVSTRNNEVVIGKLTDTHFTICGVEFTKAQLIALKALVS